MVTRTATTDLLALLEGEWDELGSLPTTRAALARWGSEDPALAFAGVDELATYVAGRATDPAARDAVLSALAARAGVDELAARVLLQLMLPGLKSLLRRFYWRDDDERVADVVAAVYARIRSFAPDPRPSWVARRLIECARMRLRTLVRQERRRCAGELLGPIHRGAAAALQDGWASAGQSASEYLAATLAERGEEPSAAEELAELLEWATGAGHLRAGEAEVIRRYRLEHVPDSAACSPGAAAAYERRRQRAEGRLRAAVAGAA